ncbi:MAG TPA: dihydrolipoyllysine-residue acetyltransferase [Rubrivivax sp.]|nr:dihydrolipoyllysine-residue acetyltransferase [Rubrivivax sp.]HRZ60213.1 dihydrolipoyllysine-residue acetyltransferase [Rubrivivax sp.]
MALVEVKVPDIGDFKDVEVIELLVKPGDTVKVEQSLATVESDKASMEIPSSHAGVVKELRIKLGDKVSEGSLLLVLESAGAAAAPAAAPAPAAPAAAAAAAPAAAPPAAAPAAPAAAGGPVEVRVPDIGDFADVAVIELLVKPGDAIAVEQSLITVESDKASMEIPSAVAGVLRELKVQIGDKVSQGSLIAIMDAAAAAGAPAPAPAAPAPAAAPSAAPSAAPAAAPAAAVQAAPAAAPHDPTAAPTGKLPHASPSVRKYARELGVPLDQVKGSGPKGRITQADVQGFVKGVMAGTQAAPRGAAAAAPGAAGFPGLLPWPQVDFTKFGEIERRDLSRIKKISGANLHRNWVVIPHVTNHDEADITELEAFRVQLNKENEKSGTKVTMLAFMIKAAVAALQKFPEFNASLDGEQLVLKKYFHIGFAADTPNGLVVPVIKDADRKGIFQLSQEMGELAKKARDGKLGPNDMAGGCFTISSLGGIGGRYFTPIINAPEVAIMGVCRSSFEPRWDGKGFHPRLILPLSLSWDHRVIDGAAAARFNVYFASLLADFRRIAL